MVNVLIADDSILTRTMLKNIFVDNGFQIIEAVNGEEAVSKYFSLKPDIVFMDLVMPKKDGLSAIRDIINKDNGARIIVCSADVQDFRVTESIEAGASDYITKPFNAENVIKVAKKCLGSSSLDEVRQDIATDRSTLKDFIKNGLIRGINALSRMIDYNIKVSISEFRSVPPSGLSGYFGVKCIGVNYFLSGNVTGCISLLIPKQSAIEVVSALMNEDMKEHEDVVHSVFNEMANVFINSYLSTFSDLIDLKITFEAPRPVDQDSLASEMKSIQFKSPVSQANVIRGKYVIDTMKFEMFLVLFTDIKSPRYKYDLRPGNNYLINESNTEKSFDIFNYMVKRGFKGLYITRNNPADIRKKIGLEKIPMVWLTPEDPKVPNCVSTTNLPKIAKVIDSYFNKTNNIIVYIDNVDFLVKTNSEGIFAGFIEELKSKNIIKKNIVLVSYDPSNFDAEFFNRKDFIIIQ